jgi:hypothetical protein
MPEGFVYILINPAMPGLVKIGLTTDTSEARAAQLSTSSGIPSEFVVVYDELVADSAAVERSLHDQFREYRPNPRREFFRIPIKTAIKALQHEAQGFAIPTGSGTRRDITAELRARSGTGSYQTSSARRMCSSTAFASSRRRDDRLPISRIGSSSKRI